MKCFNEEHISNIRLCVLSAENINIYAAYPTGQLFTAITQFIGHKTAQCYRFYKNNRNYHK